MLLEPNNLIVVKDIRTDLYKSRKGLIFILSSPIISTWCSFSSPFFHHQKRALYSRVYISLHILLLMSLLPLPESLVPFLSGYLPPSEPKRSRPFVTLTWAQSLDSRIASSPGVQTVISHLETKTMTHYLRANHDAILVGIGTVLADDPKLNCRYGGVSIRPVVVDPHAKWHYASSTLHSICEQGLGLAPYIFTDTKSKYLEEDVLAVESQGGKILTLEFCSDRAANWEPIFNAMHEQNISSVMVEGGAIVINELLKLPLVDSVVVTIGPVFLGNQGVEVSPTTGVKLKDVKWWSGVQDSVMAARLQ